MAATTRTPLSSKKGAPIFVPRRSLEEVLRMQAGVYISVTNKTPPPPPSWAPNVDSLKPTPEPALKESGPAGVEPEVRSPPCALRGAAHWPPLAKMKKSDSLVPSLPWRRADAWPEGCSRPALGGPREPVGGDGESAALPPPPPWRRREARGATACSADSEGTASTGDFSPTRMLSFVSDAGDASECSYSEEPRDGVGMEPAGVTLACRLAPASTAATDPRASCPLQASDVDALPKMSGSSWAARRRSSQGLCKKDGSDVVGTVRAILNKLTVEKFSRLSQQLLHCVTWTKANIKQLISEVFEVATNQHHFIGMYADLCVVLHEHFLTNPVSDDPESSFKRLLLSECQQSFMRGSHRPVQGDAAYTKDEWEALSMKFKKCALGNIKLIGMLCARGMLASKVFLVILAELLAQQTPESLESASALLTVVGPVFDTPKFHDRAALNEIFVKVGSVAKGPHCDARSRCLIADVLDLRARGWSDHRPRRQDAPTSLAELELRRSLEDPYYYQGFYSRVGLVHNKNSCLF